MIIASLCACGAGPAPLHPGAAGAPLSLAADARMIVVPAGQFVAGSTPEERGQAYDDYQQSAGTDTARENKWFEREEDRHLEKLPGYRIDLMPVTQAQFAEYVTAGHAQPLTIDAVSWKAQGFTQDYGTEVERFVWRDGRPPAGREDHPVVLVTWTEADRYCVWRGEIAGGKRRLPTAHEFENAARGDTGVSYPWGNTFEAKKLNSGVGGPRDTVPVGTFTVGASPYGGLDLAGNVFHWTSTPEADVPAGGPSDRSDVLGAHMLVKGSAWDDFAGVGRGASGHGRARHVRHVIVGFRCAAEGT
ncbi:MAG: formylglycine-generating enzyme family protein [Deltaproteobacteria bacterium]|nr:formylglycine-generating enzyme family protein [Deltaproteobacteria bacterium]